VKKLGFFGYSLAAFCYDFSGRAIDLTF